MNMHILTMRFLAVAVVAAGIATYPATPAIKAEERKPATENAIVFYDFQDLSGFTLNGAAAQVAGDQTRNGALRLTNALWQGASAFLTTPISISDDASFSSYFRFQMTNPMGQTGEIQGADGIVFAVQTASNEVGATGGGIGYEGIAPSVGIEFDTWRNGVDADDNHVGINLNGSRQSVVARHVETPFNNGKVWHAWVDYDGRTDRLTVRWSSGDQRPSEAMLARTVDLAEVLGKTEVFIGFSSGTGAAGNTHDILSWQFRGSFDPISNLSAGSLRLSARDLSSIGAPLKVALIMDASGSMRGRMPDGKAKIAVAKQVLSSVIRQLPNSIQIGLRVYGHRYHRNPKARSCTDTELVVPFGPIDKARLRRAVFAIKPQGQTPIGLSLSRLEEDFGDAPGEKLVVLVTDGIETCSEHPGTRHYPPDIVTSLQAKGLKVRINIVGFDIEASATRAFLQGLAAQSQGAYYDAASAHELSENLLSALSGTVPFTIFDQSGGIAGSGDVNGAPVQLPVGEYTVRLSLRGEEFVIRKIVIARDQEAGLVITGREGRELAVSRTATSAQ
ncbi:MAG: lectin-like domain-containing protein [Hyphomicrobiales bacterium]